MFQNLQITGQPLFYLFLAGSLLLSLGYVWGKRKNTRIHLSSFNSVIDVLKPRDQVFTNIGGLTGYHARIVPGKSGIVKRADLTLTLLPRQSWLYLPFSILFTKSDRLYVNLFFGKKAGTELKEEGHLVEAVFSKSDLGRVNNPDRFEIKSVGWGDKEFIMHTVKGGNTERLYNRLMETVPDPLSIKHVAIVPEENKVYMFMVPKYGAVSIVFGNFYKWVCSIAESGEN